MSERPGRIRCRPATLVRCNQHQVTAAEQLYGLAGDDPVMPPAAQALRFGLRAPDRAPPRRPAARDPGGYLPRP
jgi:hypothetical protein